MIHAGAAGRAVPSTPPVASSTSSLASCDPRKSTAGSSVEREGKLLRCGSWKTTGIVPVRVSMLGFYL